ncbi:MAG: NUDIX hydrolase [Beijerinckiaceae bacterium]
MPAVDSKKLQRQYAALPFVRSQAGVSVLLVTSRETHRWIIPKGWPVKGLSGSEVAALEAREEAGATGEVASKPIGAFVYTKRLHFFSTVECEVKVYPLEVSKQRLKWRERAQRQLIWVSPEEAAGRVQEAGLAELLRNFRG